MLKLLFVVSMILLVIIGVPVLLMSFRRIRNLIIFICILSGISLLLEGNIFSALVLFAVIVTISGISTDIKKWWKDNIDNDIDPDFIPYKNDNIIYIKNRSTNFEHCHTEYDLNKEYLRLRKKYIQEGNTKKLSQLKDDYEFKINNL